jgi:hypothetical protein
VPRPFMRLLASPSVAGFVLGSVPLLALAFFSPGLGSEGMLGKGIFLFGALTLLGLIVAARYHGWLWILVALQAIFLALVLIETFSDAALYLGT